MQKIIKRFGLLMLVGMFALPAVLTAGCESDVDEDGASLEIGD